MDHTTTNICDGTFLCFQKDLMDTLDSDVPPPANKLVYFPNLPKVHGIPAYLADQWATRRAPEDQDACRKYSLSHPTLTPGMFTIYCPHGVLLWIRSNAIAWISKASIQNFLHSFQYTTTYHRLQQPIASYINTFSIDINHISRAHLSLLVVSHWQGHVRCSSGYSLDRYTMPKPRAETLKLMSKAMLGYSALKDKLHMWQKREFRKVVLII